LFFAHLALEKILKAHVCQHTKDLAPRTHDLVGLAEHATLPIAEEQRTFLRRMTLYCVEARYPEDDLAIPYAGEAREQMETAEEILEWLTNQL